MNKEKVRELAQDLRCAEDVNGAEEMITEWLEENPIDPVVVGLSDEQIEMLFTAEQAA